MEIEELGKLAKLTIESDGHVFEVMFNPTSYSERFAVEYKKRGAANSGVEEFDYVKSIPQEFQLKIVIDGTKVSEFGSSFLPPMSGQAQPVPTQVNQFLSLTWFPKDGQPRPLTIGWGEFIFECRLKDVNIKYTLFDRSGLPLRAELDAKFVGLPEKNRANYEKRFDGNLPDSPSGSGGGGGTSTGGDSGGSGGSSGGTQNGIVISVS